MIRSPDLDSFVCCAACSKTYIPLPSKATFDWIWEYKPFRTHYYTHHDILEIGADIEPQEHEKEMAEIQEHIEKMKAELSSQAEMHKEDALSIAWKENQTEAEKHFQAAEALHLDELEKVMVTLKAAEEEVKTLAQKLETMTNWKDNLETEIQATRQAFQKCIDITFPNLSPGQADFILPHREAFEQKDTSEEAEDSD